jgi:signal transduction histidine kinase
VGERCFPNPEKIIGLTFDPSRTNNPNREVVRTRAPVSVADAPAVYDEFRRDPHAPARIRSWLGVPMLVGDRLIGMIALDRTKPGFYTETHARLAEAFAAQAAVAIENSRLFEAERGQRVLVEALAEAAAAVSSVGAPDVVLDRILEQVERIVPGDAYSVMLIDEDGAARMSRWRGHERMGLTEEQITGITVAITEHPELTGMAQDGKPHVTTDTAISHFDIMPEGWEWMRSHVGAPIRVGGATVGFLNVSSTQPEQFGPADAQRLQAFASHAATAIENAQLYQQLTNYADQLEQRVQERTAQLQAQYARLDAILHSTADGIVVTDADGLILQANPVAQSWLTRSLPTDEALRLHLAVQAVAVRADEQPVETLELTGIDLELSGAPISEPETQAIYPPQEPMQREPAAVVAVHDVSHLKALDRERRRFITNVSHELRTPITTIQAFAHLLRRTPPQDDKWITYLDGLVDEADWQVQLGEDILQMARIYAGRLAVNARPTPLDHLAQTAVEAWQGLAQERGVTLAHRPAEPGPTALADAERVTQALNILVEDAIRYAPAGARVSVSTHQAEAEGRIWATVAVSDTGEPIPEEDRPHVFERLSREEEPRSERVAGTGLRLMIVKGIVDLHEGRVTVESGSTESRAGPSASLRASEEGTGNTFTIWLPLA